MELLLIVFMYLISILWIIVGTLLVFTTDMVKTKFLNVFMPKANLKKLGPIPIVIGAILLLAASYNRSTLLVTIIGLLAIAKGVFFIVATEKAEKFNEKCLNASNNAMRAFGVGAIIIGSLVLMGI